MLQRADKRQVHQLGHDQRNDSNPHRRFNVLAGVEARRQHLHHNDAHQPDAVGDQRPLGHRRIMGGELTVLEQGNRQRPGEDRQRHGARQRQQEAQAQTPVHQAAVFILVAAGDGFRQRWQQDSTQRHTQHAGRELHQTVGVVHPGDGAGGEERGEDGVDDQ